jgi:Flp pilus assembly pilin Flp
MAKIIKRVLADSSAIEYIVVLALIAVVAITTEVVLHHS